MQQSDLMSTNDRGSNFFGIHHGVVDVGEHFEFVGDADVVAVRRQAERHHAVAHLPILERLDHPVLERHCRIQRSLLIAMLSPSVSGRPVSRQHRASERQLTTLTRMRRRNRQVERESLGVG